IEDETGVANLVIFQAIFEKFQKAVLQSRLIMAEGRLQREGDVTHVIVSACHDFSNMLSRLSSEPNEQEKVFPEGRSFK
ncbi:MAG TPA: hypothetical protein PK951_02885, partial [Chitinophagaceae bacterium]|nr:hypothetical protein [Chitinophagaceae bacterium]